MSILYIANEIGLRLLDSLHFQGAAPLKNYQFHFFAMITASACVLSSYSKVLNFARACN